MFLSTACWTQADPVTWQKHTIMESGICLTAVALDANGDSQMDVIASYKAKVSLYLAPDWREIIIHRFLGKGRGCIHSETIDVDGDGDEDWAGSLANGHPFWLENPGRENLNQNTWTARVIDPEITAIHCMVRADVDNDGRPDLVINNFSPEKGLADSMAWFSIPERPLQAERWPRYVFADRDARGGSHYMGVADIDGDGWREIAVAAKGKPFADGNWFAYWKNPGKDAVTQAWQKVVLAENQVGATNIYPCDVNGDGQMDWLASRGHGVGCLWFQGPDWQIHEIDTEIENPHALTIYDHDQDGDVDAAACGFGSQFVRWYENDGSGKFTIHDLDTNQQSYDLRTVDMDGDGDGDLLNAGRSSKNVVWYENPLK